MNSLTAKQVERCRKPGRHRIQKSLYLFVDKRSNSRSFVQRVQIAGKLVDIGLGSVKSVSLDEAKARAMLNLIEIGKGNDPRQGRVRKVAAAVQGASASRAPAFETIATRYVEQLPSERRRPAEGWLRDYCIPAFGNRPIDRITKSDILDLLEPIARDKWPTANRVRLLLSKVWEAAIARDMVQQNIVDAIRSQLDGFRDQHNEAHHGDTIAVADIPRIVSALRNIDSIATPPLLLAVFTGARINEVLRLEWQDLDLDNRTWHLPVGKSKTRRAHRVPLNDGAMQVLESAGPRESGPVFASRKGGGRIHSPTCNRILKQAASPTAKQHAFRPALVSWCLETGVTDNDCAQACIAHRTGSNSHKAYQHSDMFERRIPVMAAWSDYCMGKTPASNVASLKAGRS